MKTFTLLSLTLLISAATYSQTETKTINTESSTKNTSQETITKIIRIKGPNGEEKIIKQEEVITKAGKIKLNSADQKKEDINAVYEDEVSVQKSGSTTSNIEGYTKAADGKGYIITLTDQKGSQVAKVRPLSDGYYNVHINANTNYLGKFDAQNNFIVKKYDPAADQMVTKTYKRLQ